MPRVAPPGSVTDGEHGPRPVPPVPAVRRVVSLAPSLTEIAFALGAGPRVVGVDDYSDTPAAARSLPHLGSYLSPDVERVLALRPDLVLCQGIQAGIAARLRSAGIRVLSLDIQTIADVKAAIVAEGAALGASVPAAHVVEDIDAALGRAAELPPPSPRPRVLLIVDRTPGALRDLYAAGPGSYLDELVTRCGGVDALARSPLRFFKIGKEDVLGGRPDVILDVSHTEDPAHAASDWNQLPGAAYVPAIARHHVYVLADRMFVAPGPDLPAAVGRICALLRRP